MASNLALYTTGYEDERFEQTVSQTFHCIICTNVIKDAVTCPQNEHLFCRGCITRHLMNSQTCPTCMEPLTVDTLSEASRGVKSLLAELKIRCEFFDRGCGKFVELGDLKSHVTSCGFAPAVCPNEGCNLEVNKQDLLHHETTVCELRRVKCHHCQEIRKEMDIVKQNLATMNEKLKKLENIETKEENVENIVKLVQEQLNNQEEGINRLEAGNLQLKKSLNKLEKLLEKTTQEKSTKVEMVDQEVILPIKTLCLPEDLPEETLCSPTAEDRQISSNATTESVSSLLFERDLPCDDNEQPHGIAFFTETSSAMDQPVFQYLTSKRKKKKEK